MFPTTATTGLTDATVKGRGRILEQATPRFWGNAGWRCAHGRQVSRCKECGGGAICEHGRQRSQCKSCGDSSICEHGTRRSQCKPCTPPTTVCAHGQGRHCKRCRTPRKTTEFKHTVCTHGQLFVRCTVCITTMQQQLAALQAGLHGTALPTTTLQAGPQGPALVAPTIQAGPALHSPDLPEAVVLEPGQGTWQGEDKGTVGAQLEAHAAHDEQLLRTPLTWGVKLEREDEDGAHDTQARPPATTVGHGQKRRAGELELNGFMLRISPRGLPGAQTPDSPAQLDGMVGSADITATTASGSVASCGNGDLPNVFSPLPNVLSPQLDNFNWSSLDQQPNLPFFSDTRTQLQGWQGSLFTMLESSSPPNDEPTPPTLPETLVPVVEPAEEQQLGVGSDIEEASLDATVKAKEGSSAGQASREATVRLESSSPPNDEPTPPTLPGLLVKMLDKRNREEEERKKTAGGQPEKKTRCSCRKTRCLKRYCECFRGGVSCGKKCSCKECANTLASKFWWPETAAQAETDKGRGVDGVLIDASIAHISNVDNATFAAKNDSCNCQKSNCEQAYCKCAKNGRGCGPSCKCVGCRNKQGVKPRVVVIKRRRPIHVRRPLAPYAYATPGVNQVQGGTCHCVKSNCAKSYCACAKYGRGCGPSCTCVNCQNKLGAKPSPGANASASASAFKLLGRPGGQLGQSVSMQAGLMFLKP